MKNYSNLASNLAVSKASEALRKNGFNVHVVETSDEARKKALEIIPEGASVMSNTSLTLEETGISSEVENPAKYDSIHKKVVAMDRTKYRKKILGMRMAPDWAIGSFHALTHDGKIMMASGSGSQIPGYAYGADNVVLIAGTNKIVRNIDEGLDRIYQHSLPLESERMNKVYSTTAGSNVRRILILNSEANPERTNVILVKEVLGF